jgi:inward rectifier potassium channel
LANAVFCLIYLALGHDAIIVQLGARATTRVLQSMYLSVATMTTVGYGNLIPNGILANTVASIEAFLGLSGFAVVAGLIFARVARPTAKIRFSNVATVATGLPGPAFKFRIVNVGRNELINADVRVLLVMTENVRGIRVRRFHDLPVERSRVAFFPLDWTVVHNIGEDSPLHDHTPASLERARAEFLVLINATDDAAGQAVHARSSYRWNEVVWDRQFVDMFHRRPDGRLAVDLRRLHDLVDTGSSTGSQTLWDIGLR